MIYLKKTDGVYTVTMNGEQRAFLSLSEAINYIKEARNV